VRMCLRVVLSLLLLAMIGCSGQASYHLVVKNATAGELRSVTVAFGDFRFNFGALDPGVFASHMFPNEREPLPNEASVSWLDDAGSTVVKKVLVKPGAPDGYSNLYVTLSIESTTEVTVRFEDKQRDSGQAHPGAGANLP